MGEGSNRRDADRPGALAPAGGRRAWLPTPGLPLVYFAAAHVSLMVAFATLAIDPSVAGTFHYHPRFIALVHLVTLGWITGSILGALYIVMPLAFGVPFRATRRDVAACVAFWTGTVGMVAGFWTGGYALVGAGAVPVLGALVVVTTRTVGALRHARVPWGVRLHVALASVNVLLAGVWGLVVAASRAMGGTGWSPLAVALAHAHLAILGWAIMMIFGVAYRLVPMFVPAAMPTGRVLALSAVLLEAGTLGLAGSIAAGTTTAPWVAVVLAAFASFFAQMGRTLRSRRPRPVELPPHDWSVWQTHAAMAYLLLAAGLGAWVSVSGAGPASSWVYGVAGIVGFVAQMVVGIQGRLLPLHAWYRAFERRDGRPPVRSVHRLIDARLALAVFVLWLVGVPLLMAGLAAVRAGLVRAGATALLLAMLVNAVHGIGMLHGALPGDAAPVS